MCYDREKDPLLVLNVKLLVVSRQFTEHGIAGFGTFLGVLWLLDELFARGFGTRRIPNSFLFYVSNLDLFSSYDGRVDCPKIKQVQATEKYGAAQPDFLKSETNGGIKNIISHHLKVIKRCIFSPNLEVVAQQKSLPRP